MKKKVARPQASVSTALWSLDDKEDFRQWLLDGRGYQPPAAGDVCSRLKRLSGLCDIGGLRSKAAVEGLFSTRDVIGDDVTVSVRSQMKRAVLLYLEFGSTKRRNYKR